MFIKTEQNSYRVAFFRDDFKKFKDGRSQTITECKIFLLTGVNKPTLVGRGVTTLGKKDKANSVTGDTVALTRALANYGFQRSTRILFWKEFNRCHRRVTRFANIGGTFSGLPKIFINEARRVCAHKIVAKGNGRDWCTRHRVDCSTKVQCSVGGLYSFQERAMKKMIALGSPIGYGAASFSAHLNGGTRKLYGLGWKKIIDGRTDEAIWPRTQRLRKSTVENGCLLLRASKQFYKIVDFLFAFSRKWCIL